MDTFGEQHINTDIVCVDAGEKVPMVQNPGIKKNNTYKLYALKSRSCCGKQLVDIGFRARGDKEICTCGAIHDITDGIWWMYASRFAPMTAEFRRMAWERAASEAEALEN